MLARRLWPVVLGLVGGCFTQSGPQTYDPPYYPPPSDGGGYPPPTDYGCKTDSECGTGNVCARTFECMPASAVRVIHVNWTLLGQPASVATCANSQKLQIGFYSTSAGTDYPEWGYAPVPCVQGKFTIDKFPTSFTRASLAPQNSYETPITGTFDATGNASIDLPY
jgi:hypothetical protein